MWTGKIRLTSETNKISEHNVKVLYSCHVEQSRPQIECVFNVEMEGLQLLNPSSGNHLEARK